MKRVISLSLYFVLIFFDIAVLNNNTNFGKEAAYYQEDLSCADNTVSFRNLIYKEPVGMPQTLSSAGADLLKELTALIDSGEYFDTLKYTINYENQVFCIYESMDFRIRSTRRGIWFCRAMNYRYVTINGSKYAYNITDKFIDYQGYENPDLNNRERAYIDAVSKTISYSHNASYFESYEDQIEDAFQMFKKIGQME